ncbi:hypothetical protein V7S43_011221 [Phytophthora oleae]|uniref:Secreted protein n=1 Tax=Phytophthora oleae TaxID=2107226 RepID=A0ABD3FAP9_9STRA
MTSWTVFLSFVSWISSFNHGVDATDSWLKAPPAFMQLRWPNASLLQVSLTEPALLTGTKTFYTTDSVTVLSVRNATVFDSASRATFEVLFLIGDATQALATTVNPALNTVGLATALAKSLEVSVRTAAGDKNSSEPLWQTVTAFQGNAVTCTSLSSIDVLALYKSAPNFPAIRTGATPTGTPFLTFSVFFRNVNDPLKLPQSVVFQVRRGVAEFLGGDFNLSYVVSSGPATMATDSTLQVNQTFFLKLPATAATSMQAREVLANRVLFGDLQRLVPGTTHPVMFLNFIFASTELSSALSSLAIAGSQSFAATLTPYVFRYMNFDTFPIGNPALPEPVADTATLLQAASQDAWNARRRKKQLFHYNPDGYTATLPSDISYPSTVSVNNLDLYGVFTTTVYWANTLTHEFWLESAESIDPVTWNLFPYIPLFTEVSTSFTLLAPIVRVGNTSTPLWTLQAADPGKLDVALNFRSTDDDTLVKVELAVILHPSGDAESTVTSIARAGGSTSPLNVVVRHQSRLLRNGATDKVSKLLLYLEFGIADVTEKSVDGCAHCQQLLDWCSNESGCAALKTCVLLAIQSPIAQLIETSTTIETNDLSSLVNACLTGTATAPVDVNYLMLFTSVIRCQWKRMCPLQPTNSSIIIPSGVQLVWGNGIGQQRIQPVKTVSNFPDPINLPLNVSFAIGGRVVCFIPVWNNVTASALETKVARSCTFAKYLGAVRVNVTSNTAGASAIDLFYDGLIGPLPILSSVSSTEALSATFTTIVTPSVNIRYVSAGGPLPFAATTDRPPTNACMECKRLVLDVCLRDAKCAAMADCVMQQSNDTSTVTVATDASTTTTSLADAILKLVRADQTGTKLSLEAGITSCVPAVITNGISSVDVNGASWQKLVNASACYSRTACPLALASVFSSSWSSLASNYLTVGKWSISPSRKLQRLIYTGTTSSLTGLKIPLSLTRDGTVVTVYSAADSVSLSASLRSLIQYDDIQVVQAAVESSTSSSATKFAWTISYGHWAGALPTFISNSKEWILVGYPTIVNGVVTPNNSILELVPRSSSTTSATTTS